MDCNLDDAWACLKWPTFVEHEPRDHRHGHEIFGPFQGTHDQRPMRPRASNGNVEVVSVRLRGILPPVPGNHVTKLRFRPDKPSARTRRLLPCVFPGTVHQHAPRYTTYLDKTTLQYMSIPKPPTETRINHHN